MKYIKRVSFIVAATALVLGVRAAELGGKSSIATGMRELLGAPGLGFDRFRAGGLPTEGAAAGRAGAPMQRPLAGGDDVGSSTGASRSAGPASVPPVVDAGSDGLPRYGSVPGGSDRPTASWIGQAGPTFSGSGGYVPSLGGAPTVRLSALSLQAPVTAVPEPDAGWMALVGVGVVGWLARRKGKAPKQPQG